MYFKSAYQKKKDKLNKLRKSERYKKWRLDVFRRDNFTCVRCNIHGKYINAHHIKSFYKYKKLRFTVSNGVTLCRDCHGEFHAIYGVRDFTKKDLKEFLKT